MMVERETFLVFLHFIKGGFEYSHCIKGFFTENYIIQLLTMGFY